MEQLSINDSFFLYNDELGKVVCIKLIVKFIHPLLPLFFLNERKYYSFLILIILCTRNFTSRCRMK